MVLKDENGMSARAISPSCNDVNRQPVAGIAGRV